MFHVYPAGLRTETIPVNYLMMARRGLSRTSVSTGGVTANDNNNGNNNNFDNGLNNSGNNNSQGNTASGDNNTNSNGTRIETDSNNDYWTDLRDSLQTLIGTGEGRAVITSPQAGLVTVRAYPKELKAVREFLDQSGEHLKRQVVLEARILEVSLNEGYEQGWTGAALPSWDGGKGITGGGSLMDSPIASTPTRSSGLWGAAPVSPSPMATSTSRSACSRPRGREHPLQPARDGHQQPESGDQGGDGRILRHQRLDHHHHLGDFGPIVTPNVELTPFFSG